MQPYKKNLGKVMITPKGAWRDTNNYDILSLVNDDSTDRCYISKTYVPVGITLDNREYWMPLNIAGYSDTNFMILSKKRADGQLESFTIETAIASIAEVNRRVGCVICFFNDNTDRLDIGGSWEIWQFNDTNLYNWDNVTSWNNIYYNYNKFVGWFANEAKLKARYAYPDVGMYAYAGTQLNEAVVYRCDVKLIWSKTNESAKDYVKVIVKGNVTVGENGNWFVDGVDTCIPASIKGDNGKTPYFRNNANKLEYSYDEIAWYEISDYLAHYYRYYNNKLQHSNDNIIWEDVSDYISAWFRWSSDNKIQISRDGSTWTDLSNTFTDNVRIQRYIGVDESLPTSNIAEGAIYMKGPYYAEHDTLNDNPIYRMWVYAWKDNILAWQDNGEFTSIAAGIVQETGDSENVVMSQKATTQKLSELESEILGHKLNAYAENASILIPLSLNVKANESFSLKLDGRGTLNSALVYFNSTNGEQIVMNDGVVYEFNKAYDITNLQIYIREIDFIQSGDFAIIYNQGNSLNSRLLLIEGHTDEIASVYFTGIKKPTFTIVNKTDIDVFLPSDCEMQMFSPIGGINYTYTITESETYRLTYDTGLFYDNNNKKIIVQRLSNKNKNIYFLFSYNGGASYNGALSSFAIKQFIDESSVDYIAAYFTGIKRPSFVFGKNQAAITLPSDTTLCLIPMTGGYEIQIALTTEETYNLSYDVGLYYNKTNANLTTKINSKKNESDILLFTYSGNGIFGLLSGFANGEIYRFATSIPISVYFSGIKQPKFVFNGTTNLTVTLPSECEMRMHPTFGGNEFIYTITNEESYKIGYDQTLFYNMRTGKLVVAGSYSTKDTERITLLSYNGGGLAGALASYAIGNAVRDISTNKYVGVTSKGIVELNPDIKPMLTQVNAKSNDGYQKVNRLKLLSLLHFSDIHAASNILSRIIEFNEFYNSMITDVICTGDMVNNKYSDGMSWWDVAGSEKFMMCIGNHDVTEGTNGYMVSEHTQEEVYNRYFSSRKDNWGIVIDNNKTYWYKDYDIEKVRMVSINQFLIGNESEEQNIWLASVLSESKTMGYSVVALVHCPPSNSELIECNFTSKAPLLSKNIMNNNALSVVQTYIDGGGDFICWLCGHTHCDFVCTHKDYPSQIFIAVANAYAGGSDSDFDRVNGDKSQDCFNIVCFDTYSKVIKVLRVGADRDNMLRSRKALTISYDSKTPIYQE